jgi:hypothetical protein
MQSERIDWRLIMKVNGVIHLFSPRNQLIDYACGNTTIPPVENTLTPLMNAISGMTFTVGQFEMLVTDIQPLDPILKPGHYSGTGKITVAFCDITFV